MVSTPKMPEFPDDLPTVALFRLAYNVLSIRIFDAVVSGGYGDLRPAHGNVMEQFGREDGLRLTDLASGAGMTAQSMSELVDDLERKGYVERRPDPSDRRAKRIYLTEKGKHNVSVAAQAVADTEASIIEALGREGYEEVRRLVQAVIARESKSHNA